MNRDTMNQYNKIFSNIRKKTVKERVKEKIETFEFYLALFLLRKIRILLA